MPELPDEFPVPLRPDWVCEVVSPEHAVEDLVRKRRLYHAAAVPHYWIVDPQTRTLEALRLGHRVFVLSGRPAQARGPLLPRGAPPRDVADPTLIAHEAELLGELTRSAALQEAS